MLKINYIKMDDSIELKNHTDGAIGTDLTAALLTEPLVLAPGEQQKISSGIKIQPELSPWLQQYAEHLSVACLVIPRSGAGSLGVSLANTMGLIDPDYQGELIMNVKNHSSVDLVIQPKQRICQMFFVPTFKPSFEEIKEFEVKTARGEGGFGNSGTH